MDPVNLLHFTHYCNQRQHPHELEMLSHDQGKLISHEIKKTVTLFSENLITILRSFDHDYGINRDQVLRRE